MLFLGIAKGAVEYARRSPVPEAHAPGTNAILVHGLLAVAVVVLVIAVQVRRAGRPGERGRRRGPRRSRPAPPDGWGGRSGSRTGCRSRTWPGSATVLLVLVVAYAPARMGAQVIGGLDPNSTVNAWGGPTYIGAMLAHYLDALVGFYAVCFLLGRLLLPASG